MIVGIDVGSVSINLTVLADVKSQNLTSTAINGQSKIKNQGLTPCYDEYIRIEGDPLERTYEALKKLFSIYPRETIKGMAITGCAGKLISRILHIPFINEIIAQTKATSFFHPEVRTIIEMGGEDSKFILLDYEEKLNAHVIKDFSMNTICAAGTGSFLDQQASRLGLSIGEFGKLALRSAHPPRIAGRCSVFAKTDMIHLQQEATPDYDIVAGLCYALARNFKATIAHNKDFKRPISFQGGVAANRGMVRAFTDTLELAEGELVIPQYFASMGAIGAALALMEKANPAGNFKEIEELKKYAQRAKDESARLKPLEESKGKILNHIWNESPALSDQKKIPVYLGIDVGSISTNVVAIDEEKRLVSRQYLMTAGRPIEAVRKGIEAIGKEIVSFVEIKGVATTGSGRYMTGDLVGADIVKNEITAQARASLEIDKSVDTIFEIGGQDSKYISLENGAVCDFTMNKVCAAGTGSFLEEQAERMRLKIKEEFGQCALRAKAPIELGERCTVFMETSIVNHQQQGASREDLVAGLAYSIVYNYLNRVVGDKKIGRNIFFQGAVAHNKAVVAAFEKVLGRAITVPPHNDVTGAIGAALIVWEHMKKKGKAKSNFKGFDLSKRHYEISTFECKGCANRCEIKKVEVEGEKPLYYGSRCEKYEVKHSSVAKNIPDLFAEREKLLLKGLEEKGKIKEPKITVGMPRCLIFHEFMPFFISFFKELGIEIILSEATNKEIIHNGAEAVISEHCFPVKAGHGHVLNLMEKGCRYIFLPSIINMPSEDQRIGHSYACPFEQAFPDVARAALKPQERGVEFLSPVIYLHEDRIDWHKDLFGLGKKLGCRKGEVSRAIKKGLEKQKEFYARIKERGKEIIEGLKNKAIVIVGRPYNTCDAGLNMEIPKKLREMGLLPIPMDFLQPEKVSIAEDWPNMYWSYGQKILSALRLIKAHRYLYPLYITNFGCGPDSFILKFFSKEMGKKPYLAIEVDEHSAGAGVITRCEAFFDSLEHMGEIVESHIKVFPSRKENLKGRVLYIPFMGNHAYVVASSFKACGINSQVIPLADAQSIELGRKYTTGKECYPCILTTGDMVKMVKKKDFNPQESAFFMPEASGPCRFGQYNKLQRIVLDELGYPDVPIIAPNQAADFYRTLGGYGKDFDRRAWLGICAVDIMDKLSREIRPYEINKGEMDRVYDQCLKSLCQKIENGQIHQYEKVRQETKEAFSQIKIRKARPKPIIGVVGEIYVRCHHFANDNIVKTIEELGGEAWLPTTAEWFFYTNRGRKQDDLRKKDYPTYLIDSSRDLWQKHIEHQWEKDFTGLLVNLHEIEIEKVLDYSHPYLHKSVEGEAVLSVGKAIDFIKKGASGIINVMPFTCMPGTNVLAIMTRVKQDYDNIPFLNMAYDGLEQATARTRLEAFMYQAQQYKKIGTDT